MSFKYALEIAMNNDNVQLPNIIGDSEQTDFSTFSYKNLYYGFKVEDVYRFPFDDEKHFCRRFVLEGESTLIELKATFLRLTKEVFLSEMPTKQFKDCIEILNKLLQEQDENNFEDNTEYTTSYHHPLFGLKLSLTKVPAPIKKDPTPDGTVTGNMWKVSVFLKDKNNKTEFHHDDHAFCIKPESAVHEVLDRIFRTYPDILDRYEIEDPIHVEKINKSALKFSFFVYSDGEEK